MEDIGILKQSLPYLKQYRDKTFVIKLGGELVEEKTLLANLAADLSLLYQLSIRIVIVHGGGPQLSRLTKSLGIPTQKVAGRRITDDSTLEAAKMVFSGISTDILAALRAQGTRAVGLSGIDGDLVLARRRPPKEVLDPETGERKFVDFMNVGDIVEIRPLLLEVLLGSRFVPVVASLAADDEGRVLNINADTIACEIARVVHAEKLFILSDVNGVLGNPDDASSRYSYLTIRKSRELIERGIVVGGMLVKVQAAMAAVEGGVPRVHILDGFQTNALLREVFTRTGYGTMMIRDEDEQAYLQRG
ncbi:MAG: acetylglutamate kinase [Planctomycetes bacterium]|nr:acetylglutamate kinase [Planctomycetota bacterium]